MSKDISNTARTCAREGAKVARVIGMSLDIVDTQKGTWGPDWLFEAPVPRRQTAGGQEGPQEPAGAVAAVPTSNPPTPLLWRAQIADWPVPWREQWGRRTAELEDFGLSWREAEERAFDELTEPETD